MNYLKTAIHLLSLKFQAHIVFRTDAIFNLLRGIFNIIITLLFFEVIFANVKTIAGWNKGEVYVLTGCAYIISNLSFSFFTTGILSLAILVRRGRLDKYLIQPFPTALMIALREPRFDTFYRLPSDLIIFFYGLFLTGFVPSLYNSILFIISIFLSILIYVIMNYIITSLCFWLIAMYNLYWILFDFFEFAKYPEKIYTGLFRKIFMTILPFIILANFPARILLGKGNFNYLFYQAILLLSFLILFNFLWKKGLKRYEGASI